MNRVSPFFLVLAMLLAFQSDFRAASSASLGKPTGSVILRVSGAIEFSNINGEAHFDYDMLEDLGFVKLVTWTPWTEGMPEFEGVSAKDLMAAVGAKGKVLHARALNDYKVDIPLSDFDKFEVIFALKQDGKRMRIREMGPIWVIYKDPYTPDISDKMIWQLSDLQVE